VGSPKLGRTPPLTEDETLERIRHTLESGTQSVDLRDDAAVVDIPGGGSLVVSVDSVVEGVHVDLSLCSPADVGWKALMGALSDLAAMGARPVGALVALCVAPGLEEGAGEGGVTLGVMEGVAEASRTAGCPVVGGDVSSGGELVVAVTVMGTVDGDLPVMRTGARGGDVVLLTGPCGGSAAGLRQLRAGGGGERAAEAADQSWAYRRPVARLREGTTARLCGVHAMIDVSDGLALDLHRLANASNVGFDLDALPVADGATPDEALGGGEDYELVMVVGPADVDALIGAFTSEGLRPPLRLGVIADDPDHRVLHGEPLGQLGWQHRLG